MRRTINTRAIKTAGTERKSRKIAAEAAQEVGSFSYTSPVLTGITIADIDIATNGSGKARSNARLKARRRRKLRADFNEKLRCVRS